MRENNQEASPPPCFHGFPISFSTVKDTSGRVLSGGIANRYVTLVRDKLEFLFHNAYFRFQTRLKGVEDFLDESHPGQVPLGPQLIQSV